MGLWFLYFSTWWKKGLKLKILPFKWNQLLAGADRNLCSKLTEKSFILPLTQPPTAHSGSGGAVCTGWRAWYYSRVCSGFSFFLLWYKGMDSVEKEVSNLLCINFTSKSCSQSTLLQRITLAEPFQHLHSWQSADSLFPHQCSKYSWLGKDANISSRSPPWAPKTKNKSKALVNLQKARSMFFFYLEIRFCTVWQKG